QETGNYDRDDEFEQIYTHAASRSQQGSAERFKMRGCVNDERTKICRSEQPALINLFPNEGPSFYRFGRSGECQRSIAKTSNECPNRFSQAECKPRRWTQHYEKTDSSNGNRRRYAMAMQFMREPIEDRVERYGNDDAPNDDRQKRSDQEQRPVAQKSQADDSNGQQQELVV